MSGKPRRVRHKVAWHKMTPDKAFWLFAGFSALVFLMGGGSRFDIASVGPLRALSAVFLAIAVYFQTPQTFSRVVMPVTLILLLGVWMAIQLIPLPQSWWTSLHGREAIAAAGEIAGLGDVSRPITFSPLRTMNSMASLVVPLTALLLLALLDERGWRRVRTLIVAAGVASALLGIAQITLRGSPGLYLYDITNADSAVGLFSNRNHNALFLNIALLFSIFAGSARKPSWQPEYLFILAARIILLGGILINGSRFGFVLLAFVLIVFSGRAILAGRNMSGPSRSRRPSRQMLTGALAGLVALGLIGFFAAMDRIPAIGRLFEAGVAEGLRARSFPDVLGMAFDHFPFGVGFGAFEQAYRIIEAEDLLSPAYFNQAHNDWLQIVVEGGLPAVIIVLLAIVLIARRAWVNWKTRDKPAADPQLALLGLCTIFMVAMHSVVDYPLRVPAIMCVAIIALGMVFRHDTTEARV